MSKKAKKAKKAQEKLALQIRTCDTLSMVDNEIEKEGSPMRAVETKMHDSGMAA
jgi:hypothetical protein